MCTEGKWYDFSEKVENWKGVAVEAGGTFRLGEEGASRTTSRSFINTVESGRPPKSEL